MPRHVVPSNMSLMEFPIIPGSIPLADFGMMVIVCPLATVTPDDSVIFPVPGFMTVQVKPLDTVPSVKVTAPPVLMTKPLSSPVTIVVLAETERTGTAEKLINEIMISEKIDRNFIVFLF